LVKAQDRALPLPLGARRGLLAVVALCLPVSIWFLFGVVIDAKGADPPLLQVPDPLDGNEWIFGVPVTIALVMSIAYLTWRRAWSDTDMVRFGAVLAIGLVVGITAGIAALRTDGANIGGVLMVGACVVVVPVLGLIALCGSFRR
jgi:tellurite resistance protein TehA-like permease